MAADKLLSLEPLSTKVIEEIEPCSTTFSVVLWRGSRMQIREG